MNEYDELHNNIQSLYADVSACLLAITNALQAKGVLSKAELTEAAQERLLAMQPNGKPSAAAHYDLPLLRLLATDLNASPKEPLSYTLPDDPHE